MIFVQSFTHFFKYFFSSFCGNLLHQHFPKYFFTFRGTSRGSSWYEAHGLTKSGHDICPIFYAFFKYIFSFRFTSGGSSWYEAHATRPPCFYPLHSRTTEAGCKSGKVQPSNITITIITTWSNLMYLSVLLRRFIQADTPAHKSAEKYTLQHQFHVLVCNPTVKARNVATKHLFLK